MAAIPAHRAEQVARWYEIDGMSMADIAKKLDVSLNAVTYFMRKHGIVRRSASAAGKQLFENTPVTFSKNKLITEELRLLHSQGVMLYWAEGYKTSKANGVDFANSDPDMVRLFVKYLRKTYVLDENRLRAYVYCYEDQNIEELEKFWSKVTEIPVSQFTKAHVRKKFSVNSRIMQHGLVHVRYADKKLLKDIMDDIEMFRDLDS